MENCEVTTAIEAQAPTIKVLGLGFEMKELGNKEKREIGERS